MMPNRTALFAALLLPLGAQADTLYKCQTPDGRTTYTNQKSGKSCDIVSQDKPVSTFNAPSRAAKQPTPADFPRVNGDQQKARDNDRRAILEQELAIEEKNLAEARQQGQQDKAQLHDRNIASIRKEITNLK